MTFGVMVVAGIWGRLRQKRTDRSRSLEMQELAERLKFDDFNPKHDEGFAMGWGFLSPLIQGDNSYAFNILRGMYHEQALFVFDYHYQTGSGKSTKDCNLTMLMIVFKAVFPRVNIYPGGESLCSQMESVVFGDEDKIRFESAEFSRIYHVRSKDRKFAYDVCNPQLMEYLLANPGLQIEIQGPVISLAFEPQLPVEQIESNLQRLIEICSRLPQYLLTNA
jgi:hypothetical protein